MYKLNQRVNTKFGGGVIVNFEVCGPSKAFLVDEYENGARIGVRLDTPSNWLLHDKTNGVPYFLPSDLSTSNA